MALGAASLRKREAVEAFRDMLINQEPLDCASHTRRIGRQRFDERSVSSRPAEGRMVAVMIEHATGRALSVLGTGGKGGGVHVGLLGLD